MADNTPQQSKLSFWLHLAGYLAPIVLSRIPGVSQAIAPYVAVGVQSAEQIPGADGPTKLAAAVSIAQAGFGAAQAAGAHSGIVVQGHEITSAINSLVAATNAHAQ
jgi:hypothetical protein